MGRSARVPFTVKANRKDVPSKVIHLRIVSFLTFTGRVKEAESFFIDSLEEWREKMGLETMTLIGHSIGGYFSVVYALKYPSRVNKLILLSPAGVPRGPDSTLPSKEFDETSTTGTGGSAQPATQHKVQAIEAEQRKAKAQESRTRRLLMYLWEEGWSPFQVVRSTLFLGPMLVGKVCVV